MENYQIENLVVCGMGIGGRQHLFDAATETAICGRKDLLNNPKPADVNLSIIWCKNCAAKVGA